MVQHLPMPPDNSNPMESSGVSEEAALTDALNEHGFLFALSIWNRLETKNPSPWHCVEIEYPVSKAGAETRIDLVLRHQHLPNVFICLECKRPNKKYKTWVFFGNEEAEQMIYLDTFGSDRHDSFGEVHAMRERAATECRVFDYYLEAVTKKRNSDASSHSETIEKAMRQLVLGQVGFMDMLMSATPALNYCRTIPVMVTTAELIEVKFDVDNISIAEGEISHADVETKRLPFCAVNYRADTTFSPPLNRNWSPSLKGIRALDGFQPRTVFIVNSTNLPEFLAWSARYLSSL